MLQLHTWKADYEENAPFELISNRGLVSCVWEMEVLWYERCAWINHILKNPQTPDFEGYLNVFLATE